MAPLQAEAQPGRFVPRIGPPGGLKVIHRLSTGYPQGYTWPHMTVPRVFHTHHIGAGACGVRLPYVSVCRPVEHTVEHPSIIRAHAHARTSSRDTHTRAQGDQFVSESSVSRQWNTSRQHTGTHKCEYYRLHSLDRSLKCTSHTRRTRHTQRPRRSPCTTTTQHTKHTLLHTSPTT